MPITFSCPCGQQLEMADEYAGRQARCPACQAVVTVPSAPAPPQLPLATPPKARLADPEVTDDDRGAGAASLNPLDRRNPPSGRRRRDEDDEVDEGDRPRRRRRRYEDDDDYEPRRRREQPHKLWNNRVTGGIVTIVLAVLIFGVGLAMDRICFWPIIMLVFGVIGIIHGLVSGRDE